MLEIIVNTICSWILMMVGVVTINNYSNANAKIFSLKNILIVLSLATIPGLIHNEKYSGIISFINFLLIIITLKLIFKKNNSETLIDAVLVILFVFLGNVVCSFTIVHFFTIEEIRSIWYCQLVSNAIVIISMIILTILPIFKKIYIKITNSKKLKPKKVEVLFLFLLAICLIILGYDMYQYYKISYGVLINFIIIIILFSLFLIYLLERNNYNKLSSEYDEVFKYVKEFEHWIEKEQLNRHEFKNQLAVLRIMTKEKKVKRKIDSIISDNIDIEDGQINILQNLPSNGLKGLLYYKVAIANRNKINLFIDIDRSSQKDLKKLNENELKILCRLIGIYFDNAIEEAILTKKKIITLEIYRLKEKIEFVISNSLKAKKELQKIQKKGVSTKGKDRGNGLYFASKIINDAYWLNSKPI